MKRTLTTICSLFSLYVGAQNAIPRVYNPPLTGFDRIRNENPYIVVENAADPSGTNWTRESKLTLIKSPILNKTIEDHTYNWETNDWQDQYIQKDSFITEADQTTIKTDFSFVAYYYSTFSFEEKSKFIFTNDVNKRPTQIMIQIADPPTSDNYKNNYKLSIQYNTKGQRIKDTYQFYSPANIVYSYYQYNDQNAVVSFYNSNAIGDTTAKGFYSYTPENRISSRLQFSFDNDLGDWSPTAADTFEYMTSGEISKHIQYAMVSNNGSSATFRPFTIEEYKYTPTGKLSEILTHTWGGDSWKISNKMSFTYLNDKATIGYLYRSLDGVNLSPTPELRYSFAPLTATDELTKDFTSVNAFPNPANTTLSIHSEDNISGTADVYDMKGQLLLSQHFAGSSTLNTTDLPNGLYLLKLRSGNEQTQRKIVIQH